MRICIFAHSSANGGAENALKYLVSHLVGDHEIDLILPAQPGNEQEHYRRLGVNCRSVYVNWSLPHFHQGIRPYISDSFSSVVNIIGSQKYDLLITNTVVVLDGLLIAKCLSVPHLFYAHEYILGQDDDLAPTSISSGLYLKCIDQLTGLTISCSEHVSSQFLLSRSRSLPVLFPYDFSQVACSRAIVSTSDFVVQVIGNISDRKNIGFAVEVVAALCIRGLQVRLDIIGRPAESLSSVVALAKRRSIQYRIIAHQDDPYLINNGSAVVTLVASISEPFGLTIPESLRRGIPVVASRSGGPSELLSADYLFDIDNVDQCVRVLERVFAGYLFAVDQSCSAYQELSSKWSTGFVRERINLLLNEACLIAKPTAPKDFLSLAHALEGSLLGVLIARSKLALENVVSVHDVADAVASLDAEAKKSEIFDVFLKRVDQEVKHPGSSVSLDIRKFDVVPYSYSESMSVLYRDGFGLAAELSAHMLDPARIEMSQYIVMVLSELSLELGRKPLVCCVGDGLGIDSIRIAKSGCQVDYLDYESSNMSRVASRIIDHACSLDEVLEISVESTLSKRYDAIIALEVIERISDPFEFLVSMAGGLADEGLLFISECFNGVKPHWQTHLSSNEQYSGMLPWMAMDNFVLHRVNSSLFAKPYVFKKKSPGSYASNLKKFLSRKSMVRAFRSMLID